MPIYDQRIIQLDSTWISYTIEVQNDAQVILVGSRLCIYYISFTMPNALQHEHFHLGNEVGMSYEQKTTPLQIA